MKFVIRGFVVKSDGTDGAARATRAVGSPVLLGQGGALVSATRVENLALLEDRNESLSR